jgi:hypothetical protein
MLLIQCCQQLPRRRLCVARALGQQETCHKDQPPQTAYLFRTLESSRRYPDIAPRASLDLIKVFAAG